MKLMIVFRMDPSDSSCYSTVSGTRQVRVLNYFLFFFSSFPGICFQISRKERMKNNFGLEIEKQKVYNPGVC